MPAFSRTHVRHHPLKSFAIGRSRGRLAEITVDDDDSLRRPAQRYRALAKIILS
jgi:hypothetical protein